MEADFSGYATKAGIRCSDGRTIMPGAFKDQDSMRVPLVWQHGHDKPNNVLGHVLLEDREDGVYAYGFFNESDEAQQAKLRVQHKDITRLSIWANELIERSGRVIHGAIREVSLVLAGANPGAIIENVVAHGADGYEHELEDTAIIHSGEIIDPTSLVHGDEGEGETPPAAPVEGEPAAPVEGEGEPAKEVEGEPAAPVEGEGEPASEGGEAKHGVTDEDLTVADVWQTLTEEQKTVVSFMLTQAMEDGNNAAHSETNKEGTNKVEHSVFEQGNKGGKPKHELSHDAMAGIITDAQKRGSLKDAVVAYAEAHLEHGINDIDTLFPDAVALESVPEFLKRRTEWVSAFLGATRKSPFSRIKSFSADITEDEARAKGYIKGNLKKEEFFGVAKRVTTPTTVYKKQKLDRDDIVDITDFDVVAFLRGEMRLMLDEEIARAGLIGDGRDVASDDKIAETSIRPIASDHELFTTQVYVNLDDASSTVTEIIDAIIVNRSKFKGTGLPTMYTTESIISSFMLLKDTLGRRIYKSLEEIASELRVAAIVPVEVMEEEDEIVAILVNPADYVFGSTAGGQVTMFDDFDIDYNQQKYLIETRLSGCLVKLKSAICIRKTAGANVLVSPTAPTHDPEANTVTIVNTTGVVYRNAAGTVINAAGSPYTVVEGTTYEVHAEPASGYYFATSDDDQWNYEYVD